jgi:PAS domain S-box-containing protein
MPVTGHPENAEPSDLQVLAAFHELSPNPLFLVDAAGNVTFANDAVKRALEPLGPNASAGAFFPGDIDCILAHLRRREPASFLREVKVGNRIFEEYIRVRPDYDVAFINAKDITESRQAKEEVRRQAALLLALVENQVDTQVFTLDGNCCYTAFNTAHQQKMKKDYGVDIAAGRNVPDAINKPEVKAKTQRSIERALAGNSFTEVEVLPDLSTWYETSWNPIRALDGKVEGVTTIIRDITRRKRIETALAESELKYRRVFESSNDAIMLLDHERFFDCNPATLKVFGYSTREEFLGKHPAEVSPPRQADGRESRTAADENIATAFRVGRNYFEWLHQRADGALFPADVLLTPMDFRGRKVLQATVRDISVRKQADEQLRQTSSHLENLIGYANAPIMVWDPEFRITRFNRAFEHLTGRSEQEVLGQDIDLLFPAERREESLDLIRRTATGERWETVEIPILRRDGAVRTVLWNSATLFDPDGKTPVATIAQGQDITERKQYRMQVEAERDRLRRILDAMPDGVYLVGQDWRLQYVNPALLARGGPVNGRKCYEYFHGRTGPCPDCASPQVFAGGTTRREYTTRGGVTYDIQDVPVTGDDGRPARLVFLRDVTERNRTEEALRQSEERFRQAFEDSSVGKLLTGLDGRLLRVNRAFAVMLGYSVHELQSRDFQTITHPDDVTLSVEVMARLQAGTEGSARFEKRYLHQNGSVVWADLSVVLMRDVDDQPHHFVSDVQDITDRKQAEAALTESEERYRRLATEIGEGIGIGDAEERFVFANRAADELFGVRKGELVDRNLREFLDAEQAVLVQRQTARRRAGETGSYELQVTRPDGTKRWVLVTSSPQYDAAGEFAGSFGIFRDITERKQAEERDRQHLEDTNLLRDTAIGFITLDRHADVYRFIAERLARLAGEAYIVVNSYDATRDEFRVEAIEGIGGSAEAVLKLLGRPPVGITFRLAPEELRDYSGSTLMKIEGGLAALSFGKLPGVVRTTIESVFGLGDIYAMSFYWQKKVLGTMNIIMHKDVQMRDLAVVEAFVNQAAIAIQHRRDADELERHREHLAELVRGRTAELEAANRELEAFSYSVSHDLRAPLRAIDGFAQAIIDDCGPGLDAKARGHLDRVSAAAGRMAELIDDLLNLARITRLPLERKPVDLSELARDIADKLSRTAPDRRVDFTIPDGLIAPADPVLVSMVLRNLLSNAWKFTSRHASARIEFGVSPVGGERVWFVHDDGAGFDMTYVEKLFQPFQRLHSERDFAGSGIGLAIVQRIVRRHGGRVWIEGEVEKGATCRFTLEPAPREG